jgi:hypothetical protein
MLMKSLGYSEGQDPVCMVTGIPGNGEAVIAGHIIPRSTRKPILTHLGIEITDVNKPNNGVFWVKGIEDAWEKLALSFVKSNPLEDKYYMHIWDDSVRNTPLYKDSDKTVGEYNGAELCLGQHVVMKRGISYQAYQAYLHNSPSDALLRSQCLYGTPEKYPYQTEMELMRRAYLGDVEDEVTGQGEDDDDDDDGEQSVRDDLEDDLVAFSVDETGDGEAKD